MTEAEFNLLDEPWILASDLQGNETALSLTGIFRHAHERASLSGELPTQDAAVLRLLLGILHAVFSRVDETGAPLPDPYSVLGLWERLWALKKFPADIIAEYLEKYRSRFYLFHPSRPFYQIAGMDKGTRYGAAKLMGDVSESSNKTRLFQSRGGADKKSLSFPEAARWLLYLNAFDDTSSKASTRGNAQHKLPSTGAGWLGKLGMVYALGETLYETLLLNLVLADEDNKIWDIGLPAWELDQPHAEERTAIDLPYSQTTLLTLQSRRVLLERSGHSVTGYILMGGDFFPKEKAFTEQMTVWRQSPDKEDVYVPKRHDAARQLWRDFGALFVRNEKARLPGIVEWLTRLEAEGLIPSRNVRIAAASVQYGDKDFFVNDIFYDTLSINAALLSSLNEGWVERILTLLKTTEEMVYALGTLAVDMAEAAGESFQNKENAHKKKVPYRNKAKESAYFNLDMPFRGWLSSIRPQTDDKLDKSEEWRNIANNIIFNMGREIAEDAGTVAFVGKSTKDGMNTSSAFIKFKNSLAKIKKGS